MIRLSAVGAAFFVFSSAQAADLPANPPYQPMALMKTQADGLGSETFAACRRAIAEWAQPFSPLEIYTVRAGPTNWHLDGSKTAPLHVRIIYDTQGGPETRKAQIECTVDRSNQVAVQPKP